MILLGNKLSASIQSLKSFKFCPQCILCKPWAKYYLLKLSIFIAIFLFQIVGISSVSCQVITSIDLDIISQIESSNNPHAVGDAGLAKGLFQLHPCVIDDYNRLNHTSYKHDDAFNPEVARKIANFYLNVLIPKYLKHYRINDTLETRLSAYNLGISKVRKGYVASRYIAKYRRLQNATN